MIGRPSVRGALVVAIHDVAPIFQDRIGEMLEALDRLGVQRRVLKVVPNWHGADPLPKATRLLRLLQSEVERGSELVLHGLEHRTGAKLHGTLGERLRARFFASGAAEFLAFDTNQAFEAVQRALDLWTTAGLAPPSSFCPPAWLINYASQTGVGMAGIRRCIRMFGLRDLHERCWHRLPAFGNIGAGARQEAGIRVLNAMAKSTLLFLPAAKVFLHPQTGLGDAAVRGTLDAVGKLVASGWRPATYASLFP